MTIDNPTPDEVQEAVVRTGQYLEYCRRIGLYDKTVTDLRTIFAALDRAQGENERAADMINDISKEWRELYRTVEHERNQARAENARLVEEVQHRENVRLDTCALIDQMSNTNAAQAEKIKRLRDFVQRVAESTCCNMSSEAYDIVKEASK